MAKEFNITYEKDRQYSGSQFHIGRAKQWIEECQETHSQCQLGSYEGMRPSSNPRKGLWPCRLLYLGSDSAHAQLVDVASHIGSLPQYATLSHCWGPNGLPASAMTTLENFRERQTKISINTLPPTFRDAIDVTRRLGLEYLWIDALCIIQGSMDDWRNEGKIMDAIYAESSVTLAAESSVDANGGLFSDTINLDQGIDTPAQVTTTLSNGRSATLVLQVTDSRSLEVDKRTLSTRAWCLQERVLSRRIIHFFDKGILWECRRHYEVWHSPTIMVPYYCITDYGAQFGKALMGSRDDLINFQKEELLMQQQHYTTLTELEEVRELIRTRPFNLPRWHLYRTWYMYLVPVYSARQLTFFSDRLPAISSIARALHRQTNSDYLAGIWAEEIAMGLAWSPNFTKGAPEVRPEVTPRPSWSWQSYKFPVQWKMHMKHAEYWENGVKTCVQSYIQLLSHDMELVSDDSFGEVRGGRLHLRGKALFGDYTPGENYNNGQLSMRFVNRDGTARAWPPKPLSFHTTEPMPTGELVDDLSTTICLLLCSFEQYTFFLVLRKVADPNIYERKNLFNLTGWNTEWHRQQEVTDEEWGEWAHWVAHGEERDILLI